MIDVVRAHYAKQRSAGDLLHHVQDVSHFVTNQREKEIMKNKFIIASLLAVAPMGMAVAAPNNVGCGVGTIIFEGQSGVAPQVLAVTTNGTLGNQTFFISSGTLGCANDWVVANPVNVSGGRGGGRGGRAGGGAGGGGGAGES